MNLIVVGGYAPGKFEVPRDGYERIVAADSGYDTAIKLGLVPDLVVGDFDSTKYSDELVQRGYKKLNRDKDYSDTEIALMNISGGYDILGGGEGRIDHLFSIFTLFRKYGFPRFWFMRSDVLVSLNGKYSLSVKKDMEMSIFSPYGACVTTDGFKWDIQDKTLDLEYLSLSNRAEWDVVSILSDGPSFLRLDPSDFLKNFSIETH